MKIHLALEKIFRKEVHLYGAYHIGGGNINQNYRVVSDEGTFFMKTHENSKFPLLFEKEINGLNLLKQAGCLRVPEVIGSTQVNDDAYLFLDWLEPVPSKESFWSILGLNLARQHKVTHKYHGLNEDNYMSAMVQQNSKYSNWGQFFVNNRLLPLVKLAAENAFIDQLTVGKFEKYYVLAESIFPEEPPALLHGDLWKGNVLVGADGEPSVIDPAVYFGHREMDLAMTHYSGEFPPEFYEAYEAEYPLADDWSLRQEFARMYFDLVQLNMFGETFKEKIDKNLQRWL